MGFLDDNFILEDGSSASETKVEPKKVVSKEQMAIEAAEIKSLEEATLTMDQRNVSWRIKELRIADHKGDQEKINSLIKDFKEIEKCLGDESRILLELQRDKFKAIKTKESDNALNNAKLRNVEAKLGIIGYKSIIKEAARRPMRNIDDRTKVNPSVKNDDGRNFRKKVLAGGAVGLAAVIAMGAGISSCTKKGNFVRETTSTSITQTNEPTSESTTETIAATESVTLETVDPNYSAPTRPTTESTTETKGNGKKTTTKKSTPVPTKPGTVIKRLRKRTKNGKVIVLKKATPIPTQKPVKPGSETLIKPTHETVNRKALSLSLGK